MDGWLLLFLQNTTTKMVHAHEMLSVCTFSNNLQLSFLNRLFLRLQNPRTAKYMSVRLTDRHADRQTTYACLHTYTHIPMSILIYIMNTTISVLCICRIFFQIISINISHCSVCMCIKVLRAI